MTESLHQHPPICLNPLADADVMTRHPGHLRIVGQQYHLQAQEDPDPSGVISRWWTDLPSYQNPV
uniref:Uncharacterized protein n=1 Tax=Nothobranchius furzeri TaxID=105023 RepID=A0A1A8VG24_NOTFU